ncbi:hypothetical protein AB0N14_29080 [Streptomyces sp. NPDC051104]|uniref:hypothetical protein n=1 Tax=Streptomyces sp. NPDC051104 TaxID=3155044 RepID=UPI003428B106
MSLDRAPDTGGTSGAVGDDVARLVYAYDSETQGERRQAVEYAFTADNGKLYAVLAAGRLPSGRSSSGTPTRP